MARQFFIRDLLTLKAFYETEFETWAGQISQKLINV